MAIASLKFLKRPVLVLTTTNPVFQVGHDTIGPLRRLHQMEGVVLWDCEGLWGLVTAGAVAELVRQWDDFLKAKKQYPLTKSPEVRLQFSTVIPVPTAVAKVWLRG